MRPLLSITFPKDSESLKILDIRLREVGAKRPLKKTKNRRRSKKSEKNGEKKLFFVTQFLTIFKQKCSYLRPLLSITFSQGFRICKNIGHPTSGSGGKKTVKKDRKPEKIEKSEKKWRKKTFFLRGDFRQFAKKCSYLRPLLSITFPQGFRISKHIGHPTLGSGGKKNVKRYLKSEQTDGRTGGHTDRRTNRLIESIGPEGRCFENPLNL